MAPLTDSLSIRPVGKKVNSLPTGLPTGLQIRLRRSSDPIKLQVDDRAGGGMMPASGSDEAPPYY